MFLLTSEKILSGSAEPEILSLEARVEPKMKSSVTEKLWKREKIGPIQTFIFPDSRVEERDLETYREKALNDPSSAL